MTAAAELALAHRYIDMEQMRLGERLGVVWDIDRLPQDALIPALTIQSLLENALYHGIELLPEGGELNIRAWLEQGTVRIEIHNPLPEKDTKRRQRHRFAQDSVRERLAAYFGERGRLTVEAGASD